MDVEERFCRLEWMNARDLPPSHRACQADDEAYLAALHGDEAAVASSANGHADILGGRAKHDLAVSSDGGDASTRPPPPASERTLVWRQRYVRQMLLRGDSVILVAQCPSTATASPAAGAESGRGPLAAAAGRSSSAGRNRAAPTALQRGGGK